MRVISGGTSEPKMPNNYPLETNDELDRTWPPGERLLPMLLRSTMIALTITKRFYSSRQPDRGLDISQLSDRIMIEAVEYQSAFSPQIPAFSLWADVITLLGDEIP